MCLITEELLRDLQGIYSLNAVDELHRIVVDEYNCDLDLAEFKKQFEGIEWRK